MKGVEDELTPVEPKPTKRKSRKEPQSLAQKKRNAKESKKNQIDSKTEVKEKED